MFVRNIPDPVLKDMLKTLESDVPILHGQWVVKNEQNNRANVSWVRAQINNWVKTYGIKAKEVVTEPCGCLMMDNHVVSFIDQLKVRREVYTSIDEKNGQLAKKRFANQLSYEQYHARKKHPDEECKKLHLFGDEVDYLAYIYTRAMKRSRNYRGQYLTEKDIGVFASQFDHWVTNHVRKEIAFTLAGVQDTLDGLARHKLILWIKEEINERRIGDREHPNYLSHEGEWAYDDRSQAERLKTQIMAKMQDALVSTYECEVRYPDNYVNTKNVIDQRQNKMCQEAGW